MKLQNSLVEINSKLNSIRAGKHVLVGKVTDLLFSDAGHTGLHLIGRLITLHKVMQAVSFFNI